MAVSPSGNAYVTGVSDGAGTGTDVAIAAWDAGGNPLWNARYDGAASNDDGLYCNGVEFCNEEIASCDSTGNPCSDDGLFCNGAEECDPATASCASAGNPCGEGEGCDEEGDLCPNADDDGLIRVKEVSGCGCGG